ncbi:MAG: zinc ribbon domain-containing protein [Solirubrobacterales bacterium]
MADHLTQFLPRPIAGVVHTEMMPLYEFTCLNCDKHFDELRPWSEAAPPCPVCAGDTARVFSPFVAQGLQRADRADFSGVPFDRAASCGGSCGHSHH